MRRKIALIIAVSLSGLLLTILTGAAVAAPGPGTALTPTLAAAANVASPGVQIPVGQANDLVRQREAEYRAQLDELTRRIQAGQEQVTALASQEQAISDQLAQLEQERQDRAASYQSQLGTLQEQYRQRFAQYAAQLQEVQSRLAQAQALLGQ